MKLILICLTILLKVTTIQAISYAIVIGISDYKYLRKGAGDLENADRDAVKFIEFLKSTKGGSLPDENIIYLLNSEATKENIVNALSQFGNTKPTDKIWFYFSGHGDTTGLVPFEVNKNIYSMLTYQEIKLQLKNTPAKTKICIIDACMAGNIKPSKKANQNTKSAPNDINIAFLLASHKNQNSIEMGALKGGVFTNYLIKGLEGAADSNKDNYVTIKELYKFTSIIVKKRTDNKQSPTFFGKFSDNLILSSL